MGLPIPVEKWVLMHDCNLQCVSVLPGAQIHGLIPHLAVSDEGAPVAETRQDAEGQRQERGGAGATVLWSEVRGRHDGIQEAS